MALPKKLKLRPEKMSSSEFLAFAQNIIKPQENPAKQGLHVAFPYDLRASMEMKSFDASERHRWTAFVNNAGTLVHTVCPEAGILVRTKFTYPINGLGTGRMRQVVLSRIGDWVKI